MKSKTELICNEKLLIYWFSCIVCDEFRNLISFKTKCTIDLMFPK